MPNKISNEYMAAVVRKCPDAQKIVEVVYLQRAHIKKLGNEKSVIASENNKLELTIRSMAHEMDILKRQNAELRSR
jgi:hypothetical protein